MKKELSKAYLFSETEDKIYKKWEKSGFFNPDNLKLPKDAESYTIVLPPPNITDKLHLGHSSMLAIEDLLIRYHRMKGFRTLWVPGTDHAAIATQNVVERKILKEQGKTRHDLGKEKFLNEVWKFVKVTQATILNQTRKMGASLDWSRQAFTLDEQRKKAARKMFMDMYKEGIIYRGERIVNWCPRCCSTLADDEIEYKEQKTKLYTFKYDKNFPFSIATTRPETKLGDTAVAVNPKDERYKKYIGKTIDAEFAGIKLKLKVIGDRSVDINFGTGALGVTPAHSMVDWQMGEKNNLSVIKVINENGKINEGFGKYSGMSVTEAREAVVSELKKNGILKKVEEIENNLSVCYRCDTPIEPLPSKQWFVSVDKKLKRFGNKSLKERAIEVAKKKKVQFTPERFEKKYLDWMENLHDWCISRQIWFGHEIPVWYKGEEVYVGEKAPKEKGWVQDPDTLDTWFSSGMWTFSTLGWPDNFKNGKKKGDLAKFHPTSLLNTGYEILTLWVSRMIMMSEFALEEIPFEKVYLHGMVLDEKGKKMSKSKGNGIDPIDVINKFGADAVRLSLLIGNTPGNDVRIFEEKISGQRNFINKLWNVSRFILSSYDLKFGKINSSELSLADRWILNKLDNVIKITGDKINSLEFSIAGEALIDFVWDDFADWYIEASKFEKNENKGLILSHILKNILIILHPFIPFVTETIWQEAGNETLLMVEKWPAFAKASASKTTGKDFEIVKDIIIAIRNARAENKIEPSKKIKAVIYSGAKKKMLLAQSELLKNLRTGIGEIEILDKGPKIKNEIRIISNGMEIYLIGAIDKEKEKVRINKRLEELDNILKISKNKLSNKQFTENAPKQIVDAERARHFNYENEKKSLEEQLKSL